LAVKAGRKVLRFRRLKSDPPGAGLGASGRVLTLARSNDRARRSVWSGWSSGLRSGGCTGSSGSRFGRSAVGVGFTVARSVVRCGARDRLGMCASRRGRSSIRSGSGSASSCRPVRGFRRGGCGSWRSSLAMRAARRSSMNMCARSGLGSWSGARSSGGSIGRGSWCSAICGCRASRSRWVMARRVVAGW
jgi:hypothetical protein